MVTVLEDDSLIPRGKMVIIQITPLHKGKVLMLPVCTQVQTLNPIKEPRKKIHGEN